jgi:hypothetical protein
MTALPYFRPHNPSDLPLDQQFAINPALQVSIEAVSEGIIQPFDAVEIRTTPIGTIQKRTMYSMVHRIPGLLTALLSAKRSEGDESQKCPDHSMRLLCKKPGQM